MISSQFRKPGGPSQHAMSAVTIETRYIQPTLNPLTMLMVGSFYSSKISREMYPWILKIGKKMDTLIA